MAEATGRHSVESRLVVASDDSQQILRHWKIIALSDRIGDEMRGLQLPSVVTLATEDTIGKILPCIMVSMQSAVSEERAAGSLHFAGAARSDCRRGCSAKSVVGALHSSVDLKPRRLLVWRAGSRTRGDMEMETEVAIRSVEAIPEQHPAVCVVHLLLRLAWSLRIREVVYLAALVRWYVECYTHRRLQCGHTAALHQLHVAQLIRIPVVDIHNDCCGGGRCNAAHYTEQTYE